ncbi:hypothetical protein M9H77_22430 [Catharanthus roseus]|uniref:Uncharacterized protein n=1 Tax=Catharanthus roseus TaxID=4058 RepID=A0ACC0AT02_CATRO|nr:hypothetical protein M9H77_22430 [Catharanthus roseus]
MVRLAARRGDDDLGAVTDRTGRVEGRATYRPLLHLLHRVCIMTLIPLNDVSGPRLQLGAQFFEQLAESVLVDSSHSGAKYGATARGNSSSDVGLGRDSVEDPLLVPDRLDPSDLAMVQVYFCVMIGLLIFLLIFFCKCLDIPVFSYVCTPGESGSEVVQTSHPEFILFVLMSTAGQQITGCKCILAIPPSRCTDDYMPWFLPCIHPRIQNPDRLPPGVQLPTIAPITLHV